MFNPPHPGSVLKTLYLDELKLSVSDAAKGLGVTRQNLSAIINGHTRISPSMALRLGKAFSTDPEMWLNMQKNYDLWQAEQEGAEVLDKVMVLS
tara:strand:- start:2779 stop:3060 length:282 start_codon:yes stop_codon:yes gene_type:complete